MKCYSVSFCLFVSWFCWVVYSDPNDLDHHFVTCQYRAGTVLNGDDDDDDDDDWLLDAECYDSLKLLQNLQVGCLENLCCYVRAGGREGGVVYSTCQGIREET